jgi:hypothetical protein
MPQTAQRKQRLQRNKARVLRASSFWSRRRRETRSAAMVPVISASAKGAPVQTAHLKAKERRRVATRWRSFYKSRPAMRLLGAIGLVG